ncbi:stretch-activated cation channel mid1 [Massospora cicadina]|nr:stretch-activated cation channel mid1 [Massospora cicadina]
MTNAQSIRIAPLKRLGLFLLAVLGDLVAPSNVRLLIESSPFRATVEGKAQDDFYQVLDIPSDRKENPKLYVSLSICSAQDNLETSPELFYHVGGVPIFNVQAKGWQQSSVDETFKLVNPELSGLVAKEAYADYYFGYRVAVIDLTTMKPSEDSVYVAVRIPISPLSDGAVTYQLGYSLTNFPDLQPFDFNPQLLDTSDHEASILVNHHEVSNFESASFNFAEFYPSRRFNSLCSIQAIDQVGSIKADSISFKLSIEYPVPTDTFEPKTQHRLRWVVGGPQRAGRVVGHRLPPVYFRTKETNPTCFLVRNPGVCSSVYHSVNLLDENSTQSRVPTSQLSYLTWAQARIQAKLDFVNEHYLALNLALYQYDCRAHPYSPVRDCGHCLASYKDWLCALAFPKCADYPNPGGVRLQTSPLMVHPNGILRPTLKPCDFLCHYVIQDCPAMLKFRCPGVVGAPYGNYFPTLQFRRSPFSSSPTPPLPSEPFCNAMLSPLRIRSSALVFRSGSPPTAASWLWVPFILRTLV